MRKTRLIVIVAVGGATALAGTRVSQEPPAAQGRSSLTKFPASRFVLLPEREKRAISRLCSRSGPKIDGGWKPTQQQIATLESNLKRISSLRSRGSLRGVGIAHPEDCYRQYVAVTVGGHKLIYINAFCGIEDPSWRRHFVTICDGGETAWGVLYDPATGDFSDLEVNGVV